MHYLHHLPDTETVELTRHAPAIRQVVAPVASQTNTSDTQLPPPLTPTDSESTLLHSPPPCRRPTSNDEMMVIQDVSGCPTLPLLPDTNSFSGYRHAPPPPRRRRLLRPRRSPACQSIRSDPPIISNNMLMD